MLRRRANTETAVILSLENIVSSVYGQVWKCTPVIPPQEAGRRDGVGGQPQLHNEFKAILAPCLKTKKSCYPVLESKLQMHKSSKGSKRVITMNLQTKQVGVAERRARMDTHREDRTAPRVGTH